ncbi:MAG: hypothetical protein AAGB29_13460 [Planctomycetota bacterium]
MGYQRLWPRQGAPIQQDIACPVCGYNLRSLKPKSGEVCCVECGAWLKLSELLDSRLSTYEDAKQAMAAVESLAWHAIGFLLLGLLSFAAFTSLPSRYGLTDQQQAWAWVAAFASAVGALWVAFRALDRWLNTAPSLVAAVGWRVAIRSMLIALVVTVTLLISLCGVFPALLVGVKWGATWGTIAMVMAILIIPAGCYVAHRLRQVGARQFHEIETANRAVIEDVL